jgi:hypothetical protein
MEQARDTSRIGLLNEKPLHAGLKAWYAGPGDRLEVAIEGFFIDIVRCGLLVEVQTGSFFSVKKKLLRLTRRHPVRLVYPIAVERWIVQLAENGRDQVSRRKSPKRGRVEDVFRELVSFPALMKSKNFSLEVALIREEVVRRTRRTRRWRRRPWITQERRLLDVLGTRLFETPAHMAALVPEDLPEHFTTLDLARAIRRPRWLAQEMTYCLKNMGVLSQAGRQGRSILYGRRKGSAGPSHMHLVET